METKITKHYFEFDNCKYFRKNAHDLELGCYGEKNDPIGPDAYLSRQAKVKAEHLESRTRFNTRVKINWDQVIKADLETGAILKFFGLGKSGAVGFTYEQAKKDKLQLISLAISPGPLKTMLNKDADGARKYLAEEGNDGRIVSEVWVVVDMELGEHFSAFGESSASVSAFGNSLNFTATGGKYGSQTVKVSEGTTFAYRLHKVKKWNKDKTQIEEMEDDYKGFQ